MQEMFDRIAGRYELMNNLMTLGLHHLWNRRVVNESGIGPGDRAVDLACGTGTLTRALARRVGREGYVLGLDFSERMLEIARNRPEPNVEYRYGDATKLDGVDDGSFEVATIAYGARNIPDLDALFSEMTRVVKPGGRVVCLEISDPHGRLLSAFYALWFDRVVPRVGALVSGDGWAYSYLPQSVKQFVGPRELAAIMERVGLRRVRWSRMAGGIITLHVGERGPSV